MRRPGIKQPAVTLSRRDEAVVIVTARASDVRTHINESLRQVGTVHFTGDVGELIRFDKDVTATAGILYLDGNYDHTDADSWIRQVRVLRKLWGARPLIGYAPLTATAVRQGLDAVSAGVDTIALRGCDTLRHVMTRLANSRTRHDMTGEVGRHVLVAMASLSHSALQIVHYCIEHAADRLTVETLATEMGVSRRTLANRLMAAQLPPPEPLIMWTRLLVATWMLQDPHYSVNQAARALGWQEFSALRSLTMKYLGHPPNALREPGSIARVAQQLAAAGRRTQCADGVR